MRWSRVCAIAAVTVVAACSGDNEPRRAAVTTPSSAADATPPSAAADGGLALRYGTVTERNVSPGADGRDVNQAIGGANAFSLDVYRAIAAQTAGENVVLGPYTMVNALGMTYAGAAGQTADEMAAVLHADLPADRWHVALNAYDLTLDSRTAGTPVEWNAANKVWVQEGLPLLPPFLDTLTGAYGSPVAEADFITDAEAERAVINGWVDEQTRERIPEMLPEGILTSLTRLVLVNAVALDAPWEFPFDPSSTRDTPFQLADGTLADVPTMHYDEYLPTAFGEGWQAVELPYSGGALSMVVVMPNDLAAFEAAFDAARLAEVTSALNDGGIHLSIPKFTARTHITLNDTLIALGMPSAFDPATADLSGMTGSTGLYISTVEHEAFIEVDEEGTRAAAATGAVIAVSHGPTVTIDRPFLYVIRDRGAGTVLFVGRVLDPRAEG